jgi:hypothetical protein
MLEKVGPCFVAVRGEENVFNHAIWHHKNVKKKQVEVETTVRELKVLSHSVCASCLIFTQEKLVELISHNLQIPDENNASLKCIQFWNEMNVSQNTSFEASNRRKQKRWKVCCSRQR